MIARSRAKHAVASTIIALLALRVWQIILLREYLERPAVFIGWLAALGVAWAISKRRTSRQVVLALAIGVLICLFHWSFERAASDGREYFAQAHSVVFDRDFDFANDESVLGARGAARMYPIGTAILWAPFLILAQATLYVLNLFGAGHTLDGFTNPYQRAIGVGTLVYGCLAIVMMWRILRDYFSEWLALWTTLASIAGTFMLWYLVVENSMSHGVSMFAATLFLYVWHRGRQRSTVDPGAPTRARSTGWWIALGLSAGVMMMVRWQNVLIVLVPFAVTFWELIRRRANLLRPLAIVGVSAFAGFFPQLLCWKLVRGAWISPPAGEHGWDPTSLHVFDILLSSNHGLLTITPLAAIALFGVPWLFKRDRTLAIVLVAGFIGQVFANSASGDWWGGPGFGARRFDSCILLFAMGLASLLMWTRERPMAIPAVVIASFIALNAILMRDVRRGVLPAAGAITLPEMANAVYPRIGNPFAWPYAAYIARKYDADYSLYDRLRGRTYQNVEIDFGLPGDEMFLGHGWLPREQTPLGSYRWASGPQAVLVIPLRFSDRYSLDFRAAPFEYPNSPRQSIDVVVNDRTIQRVALLPGGLHEYHVDIPSSDTRAGLNSIRFVFGYSVSPRDVAETGDDRSLAVFFDVLRLRRGVVPLP